MCMYLTRQLPLVAKRDIICVKYLRVTADKEYKTPCQCTPVPIGEIFKAYPARVEIRNGSSITKAIHGGAIHALTYNHDKWFDGCLPCKAIIPAGTEYWVDVNGYSLAAKQMIITNQAINIEIPDESLLRDMLEQVPTVEGISVGDYYIKDKGFISPLSIKKDMLPEISGVVVGFKGTEPLIWSGEVSDGRMDTEYNSQFDKFISDPDSDFDGEKHKEAFLKNYTEKFDKDRFQAYAKCMSYKPHIGEWYIPAYAEQKEMVNNLLFVNAAAWFSHSGMFMVPGYYWTSSEYGVCSCWGIALGEDGACRDWDDRDCSRRVCFFLASTNKIPKVKIEGLTAEKEKEPILSKIRKYVRKRKA